MIGAAADRAREAIAEEARAEQHDAARSLTDDELVALTAAPFWTAPLLHAAGLVPDAIAARAGMLIQRDGVGDAAKLTITEDVAAVLVDALRERGADPLPILDRIERRLRAVTRLPQVLVEWCTLVWLAVKHGPYGLGDRFLADVDAACKDGATGYATLVIDAAGALARVLGGTLPASVRVARHRVGHAFREARDREHLAAYVERADAMHAFHALFDEGTIRALAEPRRRHEHWALHYVGVGGAGKSTLIRHIATDVARDRGLQVARVDFDYLSPAYPARDPGQLVAALVHELTMHMTRTEQDRYLRATLEQLERVAAAAHEIRGDDPLGPIAWPEFQDLLATAGTFIASFARPVFVLDTCEELSKIAIGGKVPSVEATFRLVEELHKRAPKLHVIFAGRRLFDAPPSYLARFELRGMDEAEARAMLARHLPEARHGDAALIDAILAACPEDDRIAGLGGGADERPRFSPFRLALHGRWVAGDPTVTAERLAAGGTDAYIEQRIVQRMGALEPHLPAVAVLRRFDRATFAAAIGVTVEAAASLFEELAGHEWIVGQDLPGRGLVLEAKPAVVVPLETYLIRERAEAWRLACRRAAAGLLPRLHAADAVRLPPELVDSALRALDPAAAAEAWRTLEATIDDDWQSARTLTRFLMGDGRAAADDHSLLGAAVQATHAGALVRLEPLVDVRALWEQVEATARRFAETEAPDRPIPRVEEVVESSYPPGSVEWAAAPFTSQRSEVRGPASQAARGRPPIARWLQQRAQLGHIAARAWHDPRNPDLRALADQIAAIVTVLETWDRTSTLAAPIIAAAEAILERAERDAGAESVDVSPLLRALDAIPGGSLHLFGRALVARVHALAHDGKQLVAAIHAALAAASSSVARDPVFDWRPPAGVVARVRLECLRLGFHVPALADTFRALRDLPESFRDTDESRLWSALRLHLDLTSLKSIFTRTGSTIPIFVGGPPRSDPRYAVERQFGVYVDLEARLCTGRASIDGHTDIPDLRQQLAAETAQFLVDRSLLADVARSKRARIIDLSPAELRARAVVNLESAEISEDETISVGTVLDLWAYQVIRDPGAGRAMDVFRPLVAWMLNEATGATLLTRARHAAVIEEVVALSRFTADPIAAAVPDVLGEIEAVHPDAHEAWMRLGLRAWARRHEDQQPSAMFTTLKRARTAAERALATLGEHAPRRLAQLAYGEAQLVGLRLPERAVPLYSIARAFFTTCGDEIGRGVAVLGLEIALKRLGRSVDPDVLDPPSDRTLAPGRVDEQPIAPLRARLRDPRDPLIKAFMRGESRATVAREEPRLSASGRLWQSVTVMIGVGAVTIAAFLLMDRLGYSWPEQGFSSGFWWLLATTMAGLAFGAVLFRVPARILRSRRRRRLRALAPRVQIEYRGRAPDEPEDENGHARVIIAAVGLEPIRIEYSVPSPDTHPVPTDPTQARALLPLLDRLTQIHSGAPRDEHVSTPLPIITGTPLQLYPWDGLLLARAPILSATLDPYRVVSALPATRARPGSLLASSALIRELGAGLDGKHVLHAIGRVTRVVDGLRWDLGEDLVGARLLRPSELVAPAAGEAATDALPLIILQGMPQPETEPTAASRLEMAMMRELAASLCELGASAVLVLPTTGLATTKGLIAAVAPSLRKRARPQQEDILAAARAARTFLGELIPPASEVALEVTVFVTVPPT